MIISFLLHAVVEKRRTETSFESPRTQQINHREKHGLKYRRQRLKQEQGYCIECR